MASQLEPSVVRIYANSGKVVGAGFLVSPQHILTCAHVIAFALGIRADSAEMPSAEVSVDFPIITPGKKLKAKVIFWLPVNPRQSVEDIAGLKLISPLEEAQPARLVTAEELWGHGFRVLGFPEGKSKGAWASGSFRGGIANGWVQLEDVKQSGYRLEEGFSGAPVWDEELQGVVGMAVAAEKQRTEAKAAFIIPANVLVSAWDVLQERAIAACPYRGLFAFREEDARFFFGRKVFAQQLVAAVERQSLVAVIGTSGSGKSSVVFAGLVPQLRQQEGWLIRDFRPGDRPFHNLTATLVSLLEPQMGEVDRLVELEKLATALCQGDAGLPDIVSRILKKQSDSRLLLIADQFEELYTLFQEENQRRVFLNCLLKAVNSSHNFTLVLTLRADFLGSALSYRPFADALQNADVKLGPMNPEELQRIVEEPAKLLGVRIEAGLTERMLQAVEASPGNLPLLEFALTRLWEKQERGQLTHRAYEAIGGVERALANHAEAVYNRLNDSDKERAQRVFIQLVRPGEGTEDTRRLATYEELGEENWDFVTRLADARLVVTGSQSVGTQEEDAASLHQIPNSKSVEIVHEALIREWETLRSWMNNNRNFRVWQERLKGRMGEWERHQCQNNALLQGAAVGEAKEWLDKRKTELSLSEQDFIRQSGQRQQQQLRRTISLLAGGLVAVSGLALGVGVLWRQAVWNEKNAEIGARIATLDDRWNSDKSLDALLDGMALAKELEDADWATSDNRIQGAAMLQQMVEGIQESNRLEGHNGTPFSVVFSPDGKTIASGSVDGTVKLWNREGELLQTLESRGDSVNSVAFSPDGKIIASGSEDGTVKLWNREGKLLATLEGHENRVNSVAFSPDGKTLVSGGVDGTVKLWNPEGELLQTLVGHENSVNSVAFSPDGKTIASGSEDNTVKLWNPEGELLQTLVGHSDSVSSVVFSPDGKIIASGSEDNTVKLWNRERELLATFEGSGGKIFSVTFSPDGKIIASGNIDGTVKLWNREGELLQTLVGHSDSVSSVVFSPDGNTLVSGSDDSTVKLWNRKRELLATFEGSGDEVFSVAFSPDGKTIASGNEDNTVKLWNRQGELLATLKGHRDVVRSVAFSPDRKTIASGSDDSTVKLWNRQGQFLATLKGHHDVVRSVAFSPDGETIASGSRDGTVKLWNRQGQFLATLKGSSSLVVFSPDGKTIASTSDNDVVGLWNRQGQLLTTLVGHSDSVNSVAFSPDGETIASGSWDGTVKLWNRQGELLATLEGRDNSVNGIAFSSDGKTIVSGSVDGTVKLWNQEGELLATLEGHDGSVNSVVFSPDDKTLVSGGGDGTVKLWLDVEATFAAGCNWLRNYLRNNPNVEEGERQLCHFEPSASARVVKGERLARVGDVKAAAIEFQKALELDSDIDLNPKTKAIDKDPETVARYWAASAKLTQGNDLISQGNIKKAIAAFIEAQQLDSDIDLYPDTEAIDKDPEAVARRLAALVKISEGENWVRSGNREQAIAAFIEAQQLDSDIDLYSRTEAIDKDPEAATRYWTARVKISEGMKFARQGDLERAIAAFAEAQQLDPTLEIFAGSWSTLCWNGSLYGFAAEVMNACENAVAPDPKHGGRRDSRGLARALTGNTEGAIEDFQAFLNWKRGTAKFKRQQWIDALRRGENPFTEEVLKELRDERR
ncbi:trypsin-like peptidase domain-containing protein [Oscillatoriales cyanobacterium LEGE 11467]|uniref:Intraflagellar transport protein 122 homolog n=1 Tax=Zarconia navalis LEGE 11467 TaxID=1828826 RepID=A0A928VUK1_9CYAN|nr:trypsin-like peptidase domain-containing protein [Zarconia navalis]MBE9039734.1 trypsin-like peptidase domain-containing protein [Zarconia navalis LEGE 11467]